MLNPRGCRRRERTYRGKEEEGRLAKVIGLLILGGRPSPGSIAFIHIDQLSLISQLSAKSLLSRGIDLKGLYYHLCEGEHVFMLESQGNISDAQVIEVTARAFGNIADV